jgi:O-antigen/teichoic acid export membrane protein
MSFKARLINGSIWTGIQFGASQILRLASNLILTRLLYPEAFGLMAMLMVLLEGLYLFSDVGITPNLIQSSRTDDPNYINTVRTVKVIRAAILAIGCLLVGYPASLFFNQPDLALMIPIMGIWILLDGLISPQFDLQIKKLDLKKKVKIELTGSLLSMITTISLAIFFKTPWVLIAGLYVNNIVKCALSYILIPGQKFQFAWEAEALHELFHFGKWIFFGTIATYFLTSFDRIFMGKALSIEWLAFYGIALNFVGMGKSLVMGIGGNVLFPAYSALVKEIHPEEARKKIQKIRRTLLIGVLPFVGLLVMFGDDLIRFLYDPRYHEAGNIIPILAIGSVAQVMNTSISPILLASGDSYRHFLFILYSGFATVVSIVTGFYLYGIYGAFWGVAIGSYLTYCILLCFIRKYQVWEPKFDFAVLLLVVLLSY